MDNTQFRFGGAISPPRGILTTFTDELKFMYLTRVKGFDLKKLVACVAVIEGKNEEVQKSAFLIIELAERPSISYNT